jgi:hypothetical protein
MLLMLLLQEVLGQCRQGAAPAACSAQWAPQHGITAALLTPAVASCSRGAVQGLPECYCRQGAAPAGAVASWLFSNAQAPAAATSTTVAATAAAAARTAVGQVTAVAPRLWEYGWVAASTWEGAPACWSCCGVLTAALRATQWSMCGPVC